MTEQEKLVVMMNRLKLWDFERRQRERFDRWCHGGVVSYRLPLVYRIGVANRTIGPLS